MKSTFVNILLTGALAGFAANSIAADTNAKTTYKNAKESAEQTYKTAKANCDSLSGNAKDVCVEEAKAARVHAVAEAEVQYKNTPRARNSARKDMAEADYKVAKAKCDAKSGNEKDVCIKEAKAALVTAKADAKADKKTAEARIDAKEDKNDANYRAEVEKCDSLAGPSRDACVASAKSKFGKS